MYAPTHPGFKSGGSNLVTCSSGVPAAFEIMGVENNARTIVIADTTK
jgi:hypothetical protein